MEPDEIQHQLAYFTGTEHYYKMYPNLVLTDGVKETPFGHQHALYEVVE